jgi:hypothetical protein
MKSVKCYQVGNSAVDVVRHDGRLYARIIECNRLVATHGPYTSMGLLQEQIQLMYSYFLSQMEPLTWHQWKAAQREVALRNHSSHIMQREGYLTGLALCGLKNPLVQVAFDKRDDPINKCCKKCKKIADKLSQTEDF